MKLCPYPFSRLQTSNYEGRFDPLKGTFLPCVPSWFKEEYFKIEREEKLDDIWNGKAAQELRKRMYEGDFSFCDREACQIPLYTIDELADRNIVFAETPIPKENIEAIKRKDPVMPNGPSSLYLTSDFTCNLKCPICRNETIVNAAPTKSALEEYDFVHKVRDSLEVIKMSNGGEVFYSTLQRKLLKSLNSNDFPRLRRVHIVSNGTLFSQKTYNDLSPGTNFIKDVNISIDAGSKEVYEKVRGPYWDQVVANVRWLGEMRVAGKLDYYSFHIIIVKDNFRDIPNMIKLAKECKVDRVLIQPFLKGEDQGYKNYEDAAVHLPGHPNYFELVQILDAYKEEPILYTYLNLPGYEHKISKDVDNQKAWVFYQKAEASLKENKTEEAMRFIKESISLSPREYAFHKMADIYTALELYDEVEVAMNLAAEAKAKGL
jgi:MoaA/NifB/PqqE/SkfB family radical SAM enzyme